MGLVNALMQRRIIPVSAEEKHSAKERKERHKSCNGDENRTRDVHNRNIKFMMPKTIYNKIKIQSEPRAFLSLVVSSEKHFSALAERFT